jgi:hypothetical protein
MAFSVQPEAALEQRIFRVLVEIGQHGVALVARDADDETGEATVDVKRLPARHRVRAHHRVLSTRILHPVGDAVIGVEPAVGLLAVMQRGEPVEIGFHPVRERLVGRVHVGEQRVAAARRALPDVEDRSHRRLDVAGHVGVPALAIGARGILVGIDLHQRRVALVGRRRMHMQFAELAAEGEMLVGADVLVAKEDHEIFGERAVDLVHLAVGARIVGNELADIDAGNLRADDRGELFNADGLVGVRFAGDMPITRALLAGQRRHGRSPNRS